MPTIISVAFAKGGVSKTTLSWALSSILGRHHPVIAIDMDSQCSLTLALTDEPTTIIPTIDSAFPCVLQFKPA